MQARPPIATGPFAGETAATIASRDERDRAEVTPPAAGADASDSAVLFASNVVTRPFDDNSASIAATASPRRRPPVMLIAGGALAAVAVVVVVVFAMRGGGGGDRHDSAAKTKRASASDTGERGHQPPSIEDTRRAGDAVGSGSAMRIDDDGKGEKVAAAGAEPTTADDGATDEPAAPSTEPSEPSAAPSAAPSPPVEPAVKAAPVAKRPAPTLGGKKVVLEYDNAPKEAPKKAAAAKGDETAAIGTARITYLNGNRKLFAGDADSAIKLYRQALAIYPGYVAGYRGLGLAYAQKGDKANALKAFRTYLNAVPGAKDVGLVKKRIATLQR